MLRIRTEAEARGLTEDELIHQLETGRLLRSAIFPALADQLAFESWLEERAAAESAARAAEAARAAREMAALVHEIASERKHAPRGLLVRLNHVFLNAGAALARFFQVLLPPPSHHRESLAKLTPANAFRQGLRL